MRIDKKLFSFSGSSIFNPDRVSGDSLEKEFNVKKDFLEEDEKLLWMGSPDFRYSMVTFGSPFYWVIYAILIYSAFYKYKETGVIFNVGTDIFVFSMVMIVLFTAYQAIGIIGLIYLVTNKRVIIAAPERSRNPVHFLSLRRYRKICGNVIYYDLGYIYNLRVTKLFWSNVGSISFSPAIDGRASLDSGAYDRRSVVRNTNALILQEARYATSPFNKIRAIHNVEAVSEIINENRNKRFDAPGKLYFK